MPGGSFPFFSVIIPSHGQHDRLAAGLRALARCDYPRERVEVIVVDQASGAPPRVVLAGLSSQLDLAMIELGTGGLARARNAGARHARGDYLAFIDEDCAPTSDWLREVAAQFAMNPTVAVVGRTVNALPNKLTSEATQSILDFRSLHSRQEVGRAEIASGSNLFIPVIAYRELGGFDESDRLSNGNEQEFSDRWIRSGRQIIYLPEAVVLDAHTPSIGSFLREHFNQGSGACQLNRKRVREDETQLATGQPTLSELMHYPFERRAGWRAPFLSILIATAQCSRSIGYQATRWRAVG